MEGHGETRLEKIEPKVTIKEYTVDHNSVCMTH